MAQGKNLIKIYESTKVLYKTDQTKRASDKIPVLIMNNLTDGAFHHEFQNYYAELDISSNAMVGEKKNFQEKKCTAFPFKIQKEENQEGREFFVLADWNYH